MGGEERSSGSGPLGRQRRQHAKLQDVAQREYKLQQYSYEQHCWHFLPQKRVYSKMVILVAIGALLLKGEWLASFPSVC
ncbi:hypothetical protein Y1Q_0012578 [Alligator mississippiensis]|uniref:Uncharacterized protein n=1 Tax=Alligator mississippiensis TaxID=8496 RepID=A0A151M848_ALLMI|nr:hypothetical protein Y1Q_0012578 [Alligator mississippiensis]